VLRELETAYHGYHPGPESVERPRHLEPPVASVKSVGVPSLHSHRPSFPHEEDVQKDRAPASRESLEAEVGILVVLASEPKGQVALQKEAGVNVHVLTEGRRRRSVSRELLVVEARYRDVLVAVNEVLEHRHSDPGAAADPFPSEKPYEVEQVVVKLPMPRETVLSGEPLDPVPSRDDGTRILERQDEQSFLSEPFGVSFRFLRLYDQTEGHACFP